MRVLSKELAKPSPGHRSVSGSCRAPLALTRLCVVHQCFLGLLMVSFLLTACSGQDTTGPGEVRWDREVCTRCGMAISDRNGAAEVRGGPAGQGTRLYKFDDLGCAVIWLDGQSWRDDPRTGIWVMDHRDGTWIDARSASYVTGVHSAMGYGLGAQREAAAGGMNFAAAQEYIHAVEQREHIHGGGHEHPGAESPP